jgi:ActR/RegA family two-component response regulator
MGTNEAWEVCYGMGVEWTFMRLRRFFSRQQAASVTCSQRASESVYAACVTLLFYAKMEGRLEQGYCIKFYQKLCDSQVETNQKICWVFGNDATGITQIKEWYN